MFWSTTITASLMVAGASAGVGRMGAMAPRSMMEARMEDDAAPTLQARQSNSINLTPDSSSMNLTQWNTETSALCTTALSQLAVASNPSGTAVCYNIPSLDTNTGTFMADLRLFQVSTPSGEFSSVPQQNIQVELQYNGATVSAVNVSTSSVAPRGLEARAVNPTPLQTYMFVGQIDQKQLAQPMTMGVLEALVMPTVTLKGVNTGGNTVATNVSSNEAAFVNGVFSKETIMSDLALAQLAVNEVVAGLKNGTVAFILPGVNILIFPVGLVVTGFWTIAGLAVYGFGTFQRISYRESYRQRKARAGKGMTGRI
ncbi:hypothetical protein JX266_003070 [Neoarthrinium moseri]|uniref:uncharacterized protein n=1 Tax=Neoarthrinium moseri TaxID=1658444 RepID=UPI001FDDE1EC|nr:uncharacterized protein JN550_013292 [Neoarthrinium moseri]KAI1851608.1 hypothetical protein JX266_003070 [Neoarthrinium moseri]KAI1857312.1 hypothetical protein JN550_013292 [Neoarthrinium moseri]